MAGSETEPRTRRGVRRLEPQSTQRPQREEAETVVSPNEALKAFDQHSHVKVNQQPGATAARLLIRQNLSLMYPPNSPNSFDLDDHDTLHNQVDPVAANHLTAV